MRREVTVTAAAMFWATFAHALDLQSMARELDGRLISDLALLNYYSAEALTKPDARENVCLTIGEMNGWVAAATPIFTTSESHPPLETVQQFPYVLAAHLNDIETPLRRLANLCGPIATSQERTLLKQSIDFEAPFIRAEVDKMERARNGERCTDTQQKCPWK
jgi:hypothetical protein